jgi:hypothetical protein
MPPSECSERRCLLPAVWSAQQCRFRGVECAPQSHTGEPP